MWKANKDSIEMLDSLSVIYKDLRFLRKLLDREN